MATIKDVAERAGVSIATVSCALNNTRPVHKKTKAKIMEAIRELNYVPNHAAKNLRQQNNKLIGVLLPDIKSQFHTEVFNGLADYLQNKGYLLDVAFSNGYADLECERINSFLSKDVCGMLLITCQPDNIDFFESKLTNGQTPFIFMERCPENLATNYIGFSNYDTAHYITNALIQKGYKKIAIMCGAKRFSSEKESVSGYYDSLREQNYVFDDSLVQYTNMTKEDAFNVYLNRLSQNPPDALIATSREIAEGVLSAVQYHGLRIPEDMVLISYGEESWNNNYQFQNMYLTSRPAYYMGELAAKTLLKNIEDAPSFDLTSIELEDPIVKTNFLFPEAKNKDKLVKQVCQKKEPLKILCTDTLVVHSIQLLVKNFINATEQLVDFDIVPQNQLMNRIIHSIENSEESHDLFIFDSPWMTYLVQNMCLAELREFVGNIRLFASFSV